MNDNLLSFEGHDVEVFELNGTVLFNPKHVAECLNIADVKSSIRNFNKNQIVKVKNSDVHTMHFRKLNNAGENFITESGVYKLAFRSRKPEAERFTNWVTDIVLPQIRKTGGYIPTTVQAKPMTDAEIMASALLIAQRTIEERDKALITANDTIKQLQPKADYVDMVLQAKGLLNVTQIAQDYGMSAVAFNQLLEKLGIQYKDKRTGQWILYAKYKGLGWVGSSSKDITRTDGTPDVVVHTKWTQKGRLGLYEILKKNNYIPVMEAMHEDYVNGN